MSRAIQVKSRISVFWKRKPPLRPYEVVIWVDKEPEAQFAIMARSLAEARARVVEEHGKGEISIWNDEDANKFR